MTLWPPGRQISEHVHQLTIPFSIPVAPNRSLIRSVLIHLIVDRRICLIDTGVSGSETPIFHYIRTLRRKPSEIAMIVLTHSHPDHAGATSTIRKATGCRVAAHRAELPWLEDPSRQNQERPIPGFNDLFSEPVHPDIEITGGGPLEIDDDLRIDLFHTPGHSRGSISAWFERDRVLLTGDAVPVPGAPPIYDDAVSTAQSLLMLRKIPRIRFMLAAWDPPKKDGECYKAMDDAMFYVQRVHEAVLRAGGPTDPDPRYLCRQVMEILGLPPGDINPLLMRTFSSHWNTRDRKDLFSSR
ncbi:MAG TPA: MBL fold metallo-hydrolase [Elusimicrobiota bacterium]|nr:MBL fold metallo-hydrolase [Elusimicrobiota bacterium]